MLSRRTLTTPSAGAPIWLEGASWPPSVSAPKKPNGWW